MRKVETLSAKADTAKAKIIAITKYWVRMVIEVPRVTDNKNSEK